MTKDGFDIGQRRTVFEKTAVWDLEFDGGSGPIDFDAKRWSGDMR